MTEKGGGTSHAAVVCRGMGIPGIVGCEDLKLMKKKESSKSQTKYSKEEILSL